jgi:uncharacterized protein YodC (DUF2158 family)
MKGWTMAETFNVGDVVELKSGGPKMTVTSFGPDSVHVPTVWVSWFDGTNPKNGAFPADAVQGVTDQGQPRSALPPRRN